MRQQQYKSNHLLYIIFGLVGFAIFSNMVMSCVVSTVYADTTNITTLTVTVPNSCTFSSGGGTYNETFDPNTSNNVITGNNIVTFCNDNSGYAIYAVGYSNDSYTGTNTDLIHSTNTNYNIKTDGSGTYSSSWKMKVTSVSNATIAGSFNTFQNIPSSLTKVASYTSSTDAGTITPSYQINVDAVQPPGTYTGKVKYVLVHPNTMTPGSSVYTIAYNANGGSGTMSSSTDVPTFESFTLPTNTFTAPSGYRFAGWCTVQDQTASGVIPANDPQTACTGTSFADGATITASPDTSATSGGTMTLYAYWEEIPIVWFQDATSADCGNDMHDNRGVDAYKEVAYSTAMINGKCWMTRNLDLPGGTALSQSDSNLNGSTTSYTLPASSTSGFSSSATTSLYNSNSTTCGNNSPCYSYYTYNVATAGTGPSRKSAAPSDICPKGWRLPTEAEYDTLEGTYTTGATLTGSPFLGVYAGYYYYSQFYNGGSSGYYWSSTAYNSSFAYTLGFNGSSASTSYDYKYIGYSVRCVAKS